MKKLFLLLAFTIIFTSCNEEEETPAPTITNLSPTEFILAAGETETLTITGANYGTDQSAVTVTMGGSGLTVQSVTDTRIVAEVTASTTGGTVTVTVNGQSATSSQSVTISQAPVISDFTPKIGGPGTEVTITGSYFTADTEVTFANEQTATVQFVSAEELKATVPADAETGKIKVSIDDVEVETSTDFQVVVIPVVTTTEVTDITGKTAQSGGEITDDGGGTITARGVCWSTTEEPTTDDHKTEDGTGAGSFTSSMEDLAPNTTYYARAYATNSAGTAYGSEVSFTTKLLAVTTTEVTEITASTASSGGNVSDDGGTEVTARGVVYSTNENPTVETKEGITSDGTGTGVFTSSLSGLTAETTYYVRAYAINSEDTVYGSQESFSTIVITLADNEVINPVTGRIWMDRNLGASRVATSSTDEQAYGDLYQWGRAADGHEKRTSGITTTLAKSDTPGHGDFILTFTESIFDWHYTGNNKLWQGVDGTNNPCPSGYRLPTDAEWEAELDTWSSNNASGAFASPLKLPLAGTRDVAGLLSGVGSHGFYWSSTLTAAGAGRPMVMAFISSDALLSIYEWGNGCSVRCIKD